MFAVCASSSSSCRGACEPEGTDITAWHDDGAEADIHVLGLSIGSFHLQSPTKGRVSLCKILVLCRYRLRDAETTGLFHFLCFK